MSKECKRGVARSPDPVNLWKLNANISQNAKVTDFKFGMHAPEQFRVTQSDYFLALSANGYGYVTGLISPQR